MTLPDKKALDALTRARAALLIEQPFFGTLAMRLKLSEDRSISTLATDSQRVIYNPDFINSLEQKHVRSALAHEVFHCVLDHCGASGRGINLDPERWNHAADFVVNDMLVQAGMELGDGWLHDVNWRGKTAEQIYSMLPPSPPGGGGGGGGAPSKGNPGPLDQLQSGSPDPSVQKMQAAEWKVAATQAANAAKAVGKLHESMEAFVDELKKNKVDWREQLRRFIQTAAKNDYSWARLNRKMLANGFCLPGLYSEEMGSIFIASDESGSVNQEVMAAFAAEIQAIKEDLRPEKIIIGHFAVEMGKVEEFGPDDPFKMTRFCNGGTDFRPVMEYAANLATPPVAMVYLTDLYGPFPDVPPDFPVLWVSITKDLMAPFGETLHIDVDA